jgi:hypothetical protein
VLEEFVYGIRCREVFEIIYIHSQINKRFAFDQDTSEDAGIVSLRAVQNVLYQ